MECYETSYWKVVLNVVDTSQIPLKSDNKSEHFTRRRICLYVRNSLVPQQMFVGPKNCFGKSFREK
jgi:hypothetical protein